MRCVFIPNQVLFKGTYDTTDGALTTILKSYKASADFFTCSNIPNNPRHNVGTTPRKPNQQLLIRPADSATLPPRPRGHLSLILVPTSVCATCAEGLIYIRGVNNQYVTNAALLTSIYSDYLTAAGQTVTCGSATVQPPALMAFAKSQVSIKNEKINEK